MVYVETTTVDFGALADQICNNDNCWDFTSNAKIIIDVAGTPQITYLATWSRLTAVVDFTTISLASGAYSAKLCFIKFDGSDACTMDFDLTVCVFAMPIVPDFMLLAG